MEEDIKVWRIVPVQSSKHGSGRQITPRPFTLTTSLVDVVQILVRQPCPQAQKVAPSSGLPVPTPSKWRVKETAPRRIGSGRQITRRSFAIQVMLPQLRRLPPQSQRCTEDVPAGQPDLQAAPCPQGLQLASPGAPPETTAIDAQPRESLSSFLPCLEHLLTLAKECHKEVPGPEELVDDLLVIHGTSQDSRLGMEMHQPSQAHAVACTGVLPEPTPVARRAAGHWPFMELLQPCSPGVIKTPAEGVPERFSWTGTPFHAAAALQHEDTARLDGSAVPRSEALEECSTSGMNSGLMEGVPERLMKRQRVSIPTQSPWLPYSACSTGDRSQQSAASSRNTPIAVRIRNLGMAVDDCMQRAMQAMGGPPSCPSVFTASAHATTAATPTQAPAVAVSGCVATAAKSVAAATSPFTAVHLIAPQSSHCVVEQSSTHGSKQSDSEEEEEEEEEAQLDGAEAQHSYGEMEQSSGESLVPSDDDDEGSRYSSHGTDQEQSRDDDRERGVRAPIQGPAVAVMGCVATAAKSVAAATSPFTAVDFIADTAPQSPHCVVEQSSIRGSKQSDSEEEEEEAQLDGAEAQHSYGEMEQSSGESLVQSDDDDEGSGYSSHGTDQEQSRDDDRERGVRAPIQAPAIAVMGCVATAAKFVAAATSPFTAADFIADTAPQSPHCVVEQSSIRGSEQSDSEEEEEEAQHSYGEMEQSSGESLVQSDDDDEGSGYSSHGTDQEQSRDDDRERVVPTFPVLTSVGLPVTALSSQAAGVQLLDTAAVAPAQQAAVAAAACHSQPERKRSRKERRSRNSLAGAGLIFDEAGNRRSTRNRVRPLEYWRGEGYSYDRSHASLPTVAAYHFLTPNPLWPSRPKRKARRQAAADEG